MSDNWMQVRERSGCCLNMSGTGLPGGPPCETSVSGQVIHSEPACAKKWGECACTFVDVPQHSLQCRDCTNKQELVSFIDGNGYGHILRFHAYLVVQLQGFQKVHVRKHFLTGLPVVVDKSACAVGD
eukprot:scaffold8296_cov18-Tisochrysis_lutea.AAC.8